MVGERAHIIFTKYGLNFCDFVNNNIKNKNINNNNENVSIICFSRDKFKGS